MSFCKNCGANIPDGAGFCSSCGTPVDAQQTVNPQPQQYQNTYQQSADTDAQDNKAMGIIAYFGILCLIPLFAAKQSKFAQYHARQGLTLFVFYIGYTVLTSIIKGILWNILPWTMFGIYSAISYIFSIASIFFLVLIIIGIVNAAKGECKELPLIGKIDFIAMFSKKK